MNELQDYRTPMAQGLMQPTLRLGVPAMFLGVEVIVATLRKAVAGDYAILLALIPVHLVAILATKVDPYWCAIYFAALKHPKRYEVSRA
jgi:type IV secretory pathway VirB3-like protein